MTVCESRQLVKCFVVLIAGTHDSSCMAFPGAELNMSLLDMTLEATHCRRNRGSRAMVG